MEFFIDTGMIEEIKKANEWGIIDGVTTNPTLILKSGRDRDDVIREITSIVDGPISAEVNSTTSEGMITEAMALKEIHKNVVVKLPMSKEGVKALKFCSENGIKTNVTLIFSANQALIAAKNGATYVSPFLGRVDDIGGDGLDLISEIRTIFDNYGYQTKILAASIRHPLHLKECALLGADVATIPFAVLNKVFHHPLTESGIEAFTKDFNQSKR